MESSFQNLALTDLGDTIGAAPGDRMLESVKDFGVIQPILVAETTDENGEIQLQVIDGNRRVAASRKAGLRYIPAFVLSGLEPDHIAQLTLMANGFRTSNYLTEFWAMQELERHNYSDSDVRKIAGMAGSSYELRSLLSGLHQDIFTGYHEGDISQAIAIAVAKLPAESQQSLADTYRKTGRIRQADIREVAPRQESDPAALDKHLRSAAETGIDLGISREDFLLYAGKQWDAMVSPVD